jgi:hypothetical protein
VALLHVPQASYISVTPDDFAAPVDERLLATSWKATYFQHDPSTLPQLYSGMMQPGWKSIPPAGMLNVVLSWQWLLFFRKASAP